MLQDVLHKEDQLLPLFIHNLEKRPWLGLSDTNILPYLEILLQYLYIIKEN